MSPFPYLSSAPWLAILLCIVWSFVVGFVWYSTAVFGTMWIRLTGLKVEYEKRNEGMNRAFMLEAIASFLMAFSLSFLAFITNTTNIEDYLWIGLIVAFGVGFKGFLSRAAWEQTDFKLVILNSGALLVTILGMCLILALLG
ncbi:MAG TPA: DUF1761 domain-containing protein [Candidatus Gracilibacteria bacterium]